MVMEMKKSGLKISPRAARVAKIKGIELEDVIPTGPNGRIVENDILQYSQVKKVQSESYLPASTSSMRKAIAKLTSESFATVPHFYLRSEIDATGLIELRKHLVDVVEKNSSVKMTITDLILISMGLALRDCPWANCIWQDGEIVKLDNNNVGLVVALEEGLLVPVIRKVDCLGLTDLLPERKELVLASREGRLSVEATLGAAVSLSNLGTSCVDEFSAIISPPQSSMLAVGRIHERPFVADGQLCVRPTMKLCLSVDHRVMDGGPAGEFLGRIVEYLSKPSLMLYEVSAR